MSRANAALRAGFLLFVTVLFVSVAHAQYGAAIQGTVQDKSGAAVAGANVTATNQATGVSHDTVTSGSGFYRISGLTPGTYKIEVDAPSFKKDTTDNVEVAAEAPKGLDVTLEPGPAQETITVTRPWLHIGGSNGWQGFRAAQDGVLRRRIKARNSSELLQCI